MTSTTDPKRGRPRAPIPGVKVSTWLRASDFDRLCQLARRNDRSVSAVVRRAILRRLRVR